MRQLSFLLLPLFAASSCNSNDSVKECIQDMTSNKVFIPYDSMVYISKNIEPNKNTYLMSVQNCKHKYVMYVSKERCSPCVIKNLSLWNEMLGLSRQEKLQIIFVFASAEGGVDEIRQSFYNSGLEYPILIDTCGIFLKYNPYIPPNHMYHTFLIDSQDSIKLVGDPIHNKQIRFLADKIIE